MTMTYAIVDPDWDDKTPVTEQADSPVAAVNKYYTGTVLEAPPAMYAERWTGEPGTASFGSIGNTRIPRFYVTSPEGITYVIYFE